MARGMMTLADIKLVSKRNINQLGNTLNNILHLFYTNKDVNGFNERFFDKYPGQCFEENSIDRGLGEITDGMKKIVGSYWKITSSRNLLRIKFKIRVKYMITCNIEVKYGLVNGSLGTLRKIMISIQILINCVEYIWIQWCWSRENN